MSMIWISENRDWKLGFNHGGHGENSGLGFQSNYKSTTSNSSSPLVGEDRGEGDIIPPSPCPSRQGRGVNPVTPIPINSVASVTLYVSVAAPEVFSATLYLKVLGRAPEPSPAAATSPFVSWSIEKTVTELGPSWSHPLSRTVEGACKPEYKEGKR